MLCAGFHPETVKPLGDIRDPDEFQSPETPQVGLAVGRGGWASCLSRYHPPCHLLFRKQSWWLLQPGSGELSEEHRASLGRNKQASMSLLPFTRNRLSRFRGAWDRPLESEPETWAHPPVHHLSRPMACPSLVLGQMAPTRAVSPHRSSCTCVRIACLFPLLAVNPGRQVLLRVRFCP